MSFAAAIRRELALAALAAIVAPTFLPALHAVPGLGHGDCACGVHRSPDHVVHVGDETCGHDRSEHGRRDHATSACQVQDKQAESRNASPGWTEDEADGHDCLLCELFADFLLTKPERGFIPPETDATASLRAPASPCVEVSARSAACRGPPVAV